MKNSGDEGSRSRSSRVVGGRGKCTVVGGGRESSSRASTTVGRCGGGTSAKVFSGVFSNATFFVGVGDPSFCTSRGGGKVSKLPCLDCELLLTGSSLNDPWTAP